jgi:peptidoglycan-associated lipoprotein
MSGRRSIPVVVLVILWAATAGPGCGGPEYPACETDEHCAAQDEYCIDLQCRPCREDSHCSQADSCKVCGPDFACVKRPGCCHSDLDCPEGICRLAEGSDTGECFGKCRDDTQCATGQRCDGSMCVPATTERACTTKSDCGEGEDCVDGVCAEKGCLETIYFDFDEFVIRTDARPALDRMAECIRRQPRKVRIAGHSDERGTEEYNLAISSRRATAAMRYLTTKGVPATLLTTVSYGEERPVCAGHGEDCWWRNRRVEFVFR